MEIQQLYDIYLKNPSVQTDTRKLKKGDIFFALKGPSFNGNEFAAKALEAGAAAAVIDEEKYRTDGRMILVEDVLQSLQQLALHHRRQFKIPFLAITGSNGKTTTKELIHAVLSSRFITYTTEGNLNNHIGVPLTLLKIRNDAEMAVIEMGANHHGEIASYCTYALPTHGLITNCGKAHLEGFGSVEGVRKAKGELFDAIRNTGGTVFAMTDYDYLMQMTKGIREVHGYGTKDGEVVGNVSQSDTYLEVDFEKGFNGKIRTSLVGDYNLPNVLAAVAIGKYFSVPEEKIRTAIESYQPSNSRSQLVEKNGKKIILDAYNANPSSMKVAIENFAKTAADKKVLVLGAMAELGDTSKEEHKEIVEQIGRYNWTDVILVGGDFMQIDHPYKKFENSIKAGEWLKQIDLQNAYLLIKGSRSSQMEKILDQLQ